MRQMAEPSERSEPTRPLTGAEYLETLRDDREIYIYGERVKVRSCGIRPGDACGVDHQPTPSGR
jgi:hypothetical protein